MKASEPRKVENKHLESLKEMLPEKSKTKKMHLHEVSYHAVS